MTFTVLTAEFAHETNTFNKDRTGYDALMDRFSFFGAEAIKERGSANTELAGFCDCTKKYGWNQVHVLSASAEPAGVVTRDVFDRIGGAIADAAAKNKDKLDGISKLGPIMSKSDLKKRAARLYAKALVWDDHSGFDPTAKVDLKNLERWSKAGVDYLSINVGYDVVSWQKTIQTLAAFRAWLQQRPEKYLLARTAADVRRAKRDGKMAVTFDLEGMNALNGDANMVNVYYELGVRQMLFAYNLNNLAGGGCHDGNAGLTKFGRAVIKEMNRVGMLVDCSHTSYRTTMDAMAASQAPVIFSHSCAIAVHRHGRNIVDQQIKACARTGGVIGINGVGPFLGHNDISSETFVDHVAYMADLVGPEHVGIGLDYAFDAADVDALSDNNPNYWPPSEGYGRTPTAYVPPKQLPEITETMLRRGFRDKDVLGILGGNFLRVAGAVWK